jgi:O-antigen ligase
LQQLNDASIGMAPISLETHATWLDVIEASYLIAFFCLTLYIIDSKQKIRILLYVIVLSALAQAIYGAFMILSGTEYAFFISKADINSHIGSATGTFTNRDHLAGYLEMALALGIGYMLSMMKDGGPSGGWKVWVRKWSDILLGSKARLRLILILLCLGLVLTHSRGGNIGFFSSLPIAGVIFMLFARKKPRATVIFLSSIILLDILLIGSWVGVSKVMTRLENTSIQTEQRDDVYAATLPMIQDYWLTGTGAGTYFETFPAYKTPVLSGYWIHAHNDYLEILAEQGVIGFGLLAAVVLFALFIIVQTLRRQRSSLALGMSFGSLMGIIALLVHSAVDFNLQILANSSLFMLLLALPMICRRLNTQATTVRRKA